MAKSSHSSTGVSASAPKARPTGGAARSLERLTVEPTKNGGFIVTKQFEAKKSRGVGPGGWEEPDKYAASNRKELDALLDETFGVKD